MTRPVDLSQSSQQKADATITLKPIPKIRDFKAKSQSSQPQDGDQGSQKRLSDESLASPAKRTKSFLDPEESTTTPQDSSTITLASLQRDKSDPDPTSFNSLKRGDHLFFLSFFFFSFASLPRFGESSPAAPVPSSASSPGQSKFSWALASPPPFRELLVAQQAPGSAGPPQMSTFLHLWATQLKDKNRNVGCQQPSRCK